MATIPMGNFGQAVARSAGGQPAVSHAGFQGPPADAAAAAQVQLGQTAMGVADKEAQASLALQDAARNSQAALTLARTNNAMHDAHDDVAKGVADGTIGVDQANAELGKRITKVRDDALDGWAPTQRQVMEAHLTGTMGALQRNLDGVVFKRRQQDAAGSIDAFGEEMEREALRYGAPSAVQRYSSFVKATAPSAGLDDKKQGALVQKFSERAHAAWFTNIGVDALGRGDDAALRQLREQVVGAPGEPLDPMKRATLAHTFLGWEQSILAKRDRAENQQAEAGRRRFNDAADIYNKGLDVALGGGFFSPEFISQMTEASAGTEMAGPVQNLIGSQRAIAGFASRPADERSALIERMRSDRATPGKGTDPAGEKLLQAMLTMDGKLRTQAQENPWAAAQQAGVIQDAPAINLADPGTAVAAVQARMQQIGAVENWAGRKVSPLQPVEVEQLSKFVRQMPIDQAGGMLANIGQALGDGERVAAVAHQLRDKDGSLGLAMMYASAGTTLGKKTAELVLRGEQALKDKTAMVDKAQESGWMSKIAKEVRGAYSNREVEDQVVDAAFKIAAGLYADGGGTDLERAVRLATGGIVERNGVKFPLPYGMSQRDFDARVAAIAPETLAAQAPDGQVYVGRTAVPLAQFAATLPTASLVHAGQGLYNVRAGNTVVTNAQGKRITLQVKP